MGSMKCGGHVQGTPDAWVWWWCQGTAYHVFLRLLVLPGTEQLDKWAQHVHAARPTFVFHLGSLGVPRFLSATSCLEPPFWCPTSQQSHLR